MLKSMRFGLAESASAAGAAAQQNNVYRMCENCVLHSCSPHTAIMHSCNVYYCIQIFIFANFFALFLFYTVLSTVSLFLRQFSYLQVFYFSITSSLVTLLQILLCDIQDGLLDNACVRDSFTWTWLRAVLVSRFRMHQDKRELHSHISAHTSKYPHMQEIHTHTRNDIEDNEGPVCTVWRFLEKTHLCHQVFTFQIKASSILPLLSLLVNHVGLRAEI